MNWHCSCNLFYRLLPQGDPGVLMRYAIAVALALLSDIEILAKWALVSSPGQ
jgi:hypothetical protein